MDIINNSTLNFEINVTENCNLTCVYCSEELFTKHKTNISDKHITDYIKIIQHFADSDEYSQINISYFGGEPMLNFPAIKHITNTLSVFSNINFYIITNCTILTDEMADFFVQYKDRFVIQISYDGNPNHDKNRCNSSKLIKTVYKKFKKTGVKIVVHGVICPSDFENLYDAYIDQIKLTGKSNFVVEFAHTYDHLSNENKNKYLNDLKENLSKIVKNEISIHRPKLNWFEFYNQQNALRAYCSAGIDNFSLGVDGMIYKCHGAAYSDETKKIHSICMIDDDDIFNKLKKCTEDHVCHKTLNIKCQECNSIICYNCHTSNYEHNSSISQYFDRWNSKNDDFVCEIYQLISKYIKAFDVLRKPSNKIN